MSTNFYKPCLMVLYEDDAYKRIMSGFQNNDFVNHRQIFDKEILGGVFKVQSEITNIDSDSLALLKKYPEMSLLACIDSDEKSDRINNIKSKIPSEFQNRIFILSAMDDAEALKKQLLNTGQGKFETLGKNLAEDCHDNDYELWKHEQLKHNQEELERLQQVFKIFE